MNTFEIIASLSSIISIPLAIYYARKTNNTTSEKARLDILKTLSYRLSDSHDLSYDDIQSVYKSKLREHKIVNAKFTQEDILNDLKTDIMSNAFLDNEIRNSILLNLSLVHPSAIRLPYIFRGFYRLLISPLPFILFVTSIMSCFILLCEYIFQAITYFSLMHRIDDKFVNDILIYIYNDTILHINLVLLLFLSVICFFRKKVIKQNYYYY